MRSFVFVFVIAALAGCGGVSADDPVSLVEHYMGLVCQEKFDEAAEFFVSNALVAGERPEAEAGKELRRRLVERLSGVVAGCERKRGENVVMTYSVGEPLGTEDEVKVPVEWRVGVGAAEDGRIVDVRMIKKRGRWWFVAR